MASPQIGAAVFITMRGGIPTDLGESLREITRRNVDGHAYTKEGKHSAPFRLQTVADVTSAANVEALVTAYMGIKGTVVTILDEVGNSIENVVILDVVPDRSPQQMAVATGGTASGTFLVSAVWTLQKAQAAA